MSGFTCCFWWFLLGLLLGWLLNWLFSKWMRHDETAQTTSYTPAPAAAPVVSSSPSAPARFMAGGVDLAAANAAGFTVRGDDDLQIIEGIGPKISELLKSHGVPTFAKLSTMTVQEISAILDSGGPRYKLANPGSWALQAKLCAENRWAELKKLQDELYAGVETSDDPSSPKA